MVYHFVFYEEGNTNSKYNAGISKHFCNTYIYYGYKDERYVISK